MSGEGRCHPMPSIWTRPCLLSSVLFSSAVVELQTCLLLLLFLLHDTVSAQWNIGLGWLWGVSHWQVHWASWSYFHRSIDVSSICFCAFHTTSSAFHTHLTSALQAAGVGCAAWSLALELSMRTSLVMFLLFLLLAKCHTLFKCISIYTCMNLNVLLFIIYFVLCLLDC